MKSLMPHCLVLTLLAPLMWSPTLFAQMRENLDNIRNILARDTLVKQVSIETRCFMELPAPAAHS